MALPFPNIPIMDQLISSIKEPIDKPGIEVEVKQTTMNQDELQRFLTMEQEGWKGTMQHKKTHNKSIEYIKVEDSWC